MFTTCEDARAVVFEYLEVFDNRVRRHFFRGVVFPEEFGRTYNQARR